MGHLKPGTDPAELVEVPSTQHEQVAVAATGLAVVSDPTRLKLLWLLSHGEHDVATLAGSHHPAHRQPAPGQAPARRARHATTRRPAAGLLHQGSAPAHRHPGGLFHADQVSGDKDHL